ncbi:5-methyltetrahydropteroyltriglutamate--homocysteine methyltransferase [Streptomyces sp. enrichment culture]
MPPRWSMGSPTSRRLSGNRWYSHTRWEIASAGCRCSLYDGDVLSADAPFQHDQPEEHPTRSTDVTAPAVLRTGLEAIPAERLWVSPDCGLKTRGRPETRVSLENLVAAARTARGELSAS